MLIISHCVIWQILFFVDDAGCIKGRFEICSNYGRRSMLRTVAFLPALAACLPTLAFSAEGKYDMTTCYSGPAHMIQQGDGITAASYDATAMMPGQEGTPYYNMSGRCVGQFTLINGDYNESGSCQFWNAAGDKILGVYARKGDPAKAEGTWRVVQGTGKFAGLKDDEGKWIPVSNFPPGVPNVISTCNHEWGTYSMK
jgi:hypothetical protein